MEMRANALQPVTSRFTLVRRLLALSAACLAAGWAGAQDSTPVVEARAVVAASGAHPGSTVKAAVLAKIAPGYHINDNKPTLDYLIPTELKLEPSKQVVVEKMVYPKGVLKRFEFSDRPLLVYEGTMTVGALLKVARTARPGTYALKGKFAYQACNDHACLPPASVPVSLEVKVVRRGARVKPVNADVFDRIIFE